MTLFQSSLIAFFGIVFYIMIVDKNVTDYLTLVFKMTQLNIVRLFWMIRLHPKNPITNLIKRIEYYQIAKELEKEFK